MSLVQFSRDSKMMHFAVIGLAAGSGCAALTYEIVWFQMLELILGSSAVSLAILLGTYMAGLGLGSLVLPYVVSNRHHPLWIYAAIEVAIGGIGIALMLGMSDISLIYSASAWQGLAGLLQRGAYCAMLLLAPTVLMGATLPCLARLVSSTPHGVARLGGMYAGNIAGAILGCVLSGFYLLRLYDMPTATYVAAAVNGAMALAGAAMALTMSYAPSERDGKARSAPSTKKQIPRPWSVYLAIALSGLTALGAEVIWTRLLSLLLGPSVYTFSIILAVFLLGLGLGSAGASWLARRIKDTASALGACQFLLAAGVAWSAFMIGAVLPFWPIDRALAASPWVNYQVDVLRCAWTILPPTILWGASFPFALAAASSHQKDAGWIVGAVYASNTVGSILGALGASLILIPWFGTQQAQKFLILLSVCSGLSVSTPLIWQQLRPSVAAATASGVGRTFGLLGVLVLVGALIYTVPPPAPQLIAYGRDLLKFKNLPSVLYLGEGVTSSVAVTEFERKIRYFHVAGKVEASTLPEDLRQERMLGHLSALLHPNPRSVLVVGFGAGITAGSFVLYPGIKRIVICEIEPLVPQNVGPLFKEANYDVLHDPRVQIVYDDARHYMLTTKDKFDVITSDPIHPWVKGSANLYTEQYFELVKKRLNPGGVITQWIPLYESTRPTIKSELATFFKVLPDGMIWANNLAGKSYDLVVSGFPDPTRVNLDEIIERLNRPEYARLLASLREVHFDSVADLFGTYSAQYADVKPWLVDAQLNTDTNLRLQYLAGFEYNFGSYIPLSEEIRNFRWVPPIFFVGSDQHLRALFKAINENQ